MNNLPGTIQQPIPLHSRLELARRGPGLYELPETRSATDIYDATKDEYFDAEMKLIARIHPSGAYMPRNCEIDVRNDGSFVSYHWDVIPGTETNRRRPS
jgi:hypothetical protein